MWHAGKTISLGVPGRSSLTLTPPPVLPEDPDFSLQLWFSISMSFQPTSVLFSCLNAFFNFPIINMYCSCNKKKKVSSFLKVPKNGPPRVYDKLSSYKCNSARICHFEWFLNLKINKTWIEFTFIFTVHCPVPGKLRMTSWERENFRFSNLSCAIHLWIWQVFKLQSIHL